MGLDAATVARWEERFEQLTDASGPCFKRQDLRRQASGYLQGLLGRVERKNSWQLSEYLGRAGPYGLQRLLGRARWAAERSRDVLLAYARRHLLSEDEPGVLVLDETGFLKKGRQSVGVQRQYSGTAGRIENCQIGVFLARVGSRGRALVDRELYLPESWCRDRARCAAAGRRWALETCFACAKQEAGLDEYEVRSWVGWYRHVTLSLLALAFLTAVRAAANQPRRGSRSKKGRI